MNHEPSPMNMNHQQRVRVYFNLHRKMFSIQRMTDKGWRIWLHASKVTIANPQFKVSEAGRQRVLREKRKNVHAFIVGDMVLEGADTIQPSIAVTYNPYLMDSFQVRDTGKPVHSAKYAVLEGRNILIQH